jgi:hypothetical protein
LDTSNPKAVGAWAQRSGEWLTGLGAMMVSVVVHWWCLVWAWNDITTAESHRFLVHGANHLLIINATSIDVSA